MFPILTPFCFFCFLLLNLTLNHHHRHNTHTPRRTGTLHTHYRPPSMGQLRQQEDGQRRRRGKDDFHLASIFTSTAWVIVVVLLYRPETHTHTHTHTRTSLLPPPSAALWHAVRQPDTSTHTHTLLPWQMFFFLLLNSKSRVIHTNTYTHPYAPPPTHIHTEPKTKTTYTHTLKHTSTQPWPPSRCTSNVQMPRSTRSLWSLLRLCLSSR